VGECLIMSCKDPFLQTTSWISDSSHLITGLQTFLTSYTNLP